MLGVVQDARIIIGDLALFELPIDIRNQFICDNAEYLFNDYSREARQVFETLCQKYGKEDGFYFLKRASRIYSPWSGDN